VKARACHPKSWGGERAAQRPAPRGRSRRSRFTPVSLTALPAPSRSCTTGCWANATPLWAVVEGCVVQCQLGRRRRDRNGIGLDTREAVALKAHRPVPRGAADRQIREARRATRSRVAVSVPPNVPPPDGDRRRHRHPGLAHRVARPSRNSPPGCWAKRTPLCAVLEGWRRQDQLGARACPHGDRPETTGVESGSAEA